MENNFVVEAIITFYINNKDILKAKPSEIGVLLTQVSNFFRNLGLNHTTEEIKNIWINLIQKYKELKRKNDKDEQEKWEYYKILESCYESSYLNEEKSKRMFTEELRHTLIKTFTNNKVICIIRGYDCLQLLDETRCVFQKLGYDFTHEEIRSEWQKLTTIYEFLSKRKWVSTWPYFEAMMKHFCNNFFVENTDTKLENNKRAQKQIKKVQRKGRKRKLWNGGIKKTKKVQNQKSREKIVLKHLSVVLNNEDFSNLRKKSISPNQNILSINKIEKCKPNTKCTDHILNNWKPLVVVEKLEKIKTFNSKTLQKKIYIDGKKLPVKDNEIKNVKAVEVSQNPTVGSNLYNNEALVLVEHNKIESENVNNLLGNVLSPNTSLNIKINESEVFDLEIEPETKENKKVCNLNGILCSIEKDCSQSNTISSKADTDIPVLPKPKIKFLSQTIKPSCYTKNFYKKNSKPLDQKKNKIKKNDVTNLSDMFLELVDIQKQNHQDLYEIKELVNKSNLLHGETNSLLRLITSKI